MRKFPVLVGLICAIFVSSCIPRWLVVGDDDQPTVCVAEYVAVTPSVLLGTDGCGNFWVKDSEGCWVLSDSLDTVIQIECPLPGDTLAIAR